MRKTPQLTGAEEKVMAVLWAKSPQPAYDITAALADSQAWHPNTVKTILSRLHKKGALSIRKYKNLYLYSPRFSRDEFVQAESESFLQRLFGGSVRPLLVHFVRKHKLTAADLEELRRLLNEKET